MSKTKSNEAPAPSDPDDVLRVMLNTPPKPHVAGDSKRKTRFRPKQSTGPAPKK